MTMVAVDLSALGKILKASFSGAKDYRDDFKEASAQLTISVGQAVHEGEKLVATLKLISRSFASCKIMIDDSIQWYTLAILKTTESKDTLIQQAIAAGDAYLDHYHSFFDAFLTIPYDVIRWKDWLDTPAWQSAVMSMREIYDTDEVVREAIQQNVCSFLSRYEKRDLHRNYVREHAKSMCVNYLLEECAVMKDLWVKLGCHYEIYPSGRNEAMRATYERYIKPDYSHLLKSIALRFHRR